MGGDFLSLQFSLYETNVDILCPVVFNRTYPHFLILIVLRSAFAVSSVEHSVQTSNAQ
jgi:hypothetical protein